MNRRGGLRTWDDWVGTVAGVGLAPVAPGTAGSLLWALAHLLLPEMSIWLGGAVTAVLFAVGVVAARAMERRLGTDPPRFVLDEVVGMQVTLLGVTARWDLVLVGLVLFRVFDIAKPPPIRQTEALPAGWGVMGDDLVAGGLARLGLWLWTVV